MRGSDSSSILRPMAACLASLLLVAAPVRAQQASSGSSGKDSQPVVKTFGAEGGFRSEVRSTTVGKLTEDDRKQASLLVALVFDHVDKAGDCIDAGEPKSALKDVNKGLEAIKTIRTMLPRTTVVTRTTAPDGKATFEDQTEYQDGRIPLFAAVLHAQTLAPILAARKNAMEVAGYHVAESESIASEAIADIDPIEVYLKRAAKEIQDNKPEVASRSLAHDAGPRHRGPAQQGGLGAGLGPRRDLARQEVAGGEQPRPGPGQPGRRQATPEDLQRIRLGQTSGPRSTRCSARSPISRTSSARRGTGRSARPIGVSRAPR